MEGAAGAFSFSDDEKSAWTFVSSSSSDCFKESSSSSEPSNGDGSASNVKSGISVGASG